MPTSAIGGDAFQETDITGITLPITKHNFLITSAEQVAEQVAQALEVTLLGQPRGRPQASPEVYALYLRARHFDNLKGEDNWARAVAYYRQALAVDPAYAPAWAGLARTYRYQASTDPTEFHKGLARAREAAHRGSIRSIARSGRWPGSGPPKRY